MISVILSSDDKNGEYSLETDEGCDRGFKAAPCWWLNQAD